MVTQEKVAVLFICMGNICRSPTAEGVFRALLAREGLAGRIEVDSAGTHAYHVGEPPDRRSQEAARRRGIDLAALRARQVSGADFARFDWILAMDHDNLRHLRQLCPSDAREKVHLLLSFAPETGEAEVPDPYYGGFEGFERVLDLTAAAAEGLLAAIRRRHGY